ncbi:MAG: sialate O-acetylesterase [Opitutales bacterium]|jgi:sialate O-acetylesterase|nr:sialate O-acetylesterase [Opitutales bacterium]MDP4644540.1 sialate O-acetylesterase [Opitutales bacterium]
MKTLLILILLTAPFVASLHASLQLASPFTDHMVLQRDQAVPVWGWCDTGEKVEVRFGDQVVKTTSDAEGQWRVDLKPLKASFDAETLAVSTASGERVELQDVVVGEVWICSGQSNMQFAVNSVPEIKALIPTAKNIRTFEVKRMVAFDEQARCEGSWETSIPSSAVAFSFAYMLEAKADVPVGIILTSWGSSSLEAWMPRDMVETVPHFKTIMDEFDADQETRSKIESILNGRQPWSRSDDVFLRRQTNILYNAMMHPLAPFACRGLVWYQGERNTQSMHGLVEAPFYSRNNSGMLKYGDTLKQWITRYRQEWENDAMHFLVVMLPGYGKSINGGPSSEPDSPVAHSWAWIRESQLKALDLDHVGVSNSIDLGDIKNVHPKDKLPIGERLALLAARDTLGQAVVAEGPEMSEVVKTNDSLIVHFENAAGLSTSDGAMPTGFWVSDKSGKWVRATAKIDGGTVVLRSEEINKPLYVRYAFAGYPKVNLVNGAGLPAYPFRTDSFAP